MSQNKFHIKYPHELVGLSKREIIIYIVSVLNAFKINLLNIFNVSLVCDT